MIKKKTQPDGLSGNTEEDLPFWKFDMHVHSTYSGDSINSHSVIVTNYRRTGVLPLVCDHNTTAGSVAVCRELQKIAPDIPVISAEEVMTEEGEIIGFFLSEPVRPYLPAAETVEIIHGQGGLALIPHPFCSYRSSSALFRDTLDELITAIDIIEGFNARTLKDAENRAARDYAAGRGRPISVGSDAHTPANLGRYYLELEPFSTPGDLMRSLTAPSVRYPVLIR